MEAIPAPIRSCCSLPRFQLSIYYTRRKSQTEGKADLQSDTLRQAVVQDMITVLRLKHRALSTTMIYTHVARKNKLGGEESSGLRKIET